MAPDTPLEHAADDDAAEAPQDGRVARGQRSRDAALAVAVQLASTDGLEGLSVARLAQRVGTAKSSIHASFGSKEALQLAVIERSRAILVDLVIVPALAARAGLARLEATRESWLGYLADDVFEGGCVLCSASAELDGRPGAPRDAVRTVMREWLDFLADNVAVAVRQGELDADAEPDQLAFELNAIGMAANWHHQLFGGDEAFVRARATWDRTLAAHRPADPDRTR